MRKLAIVLVPFLLLALVIGGCGGGGEERRQFLTLKPKKLPIS